jgi:predicted nuclease of predicted toxin-antitoxin system
VKIVVDMNLSPEWVSVFRRASHDARHWIEIGDPSAPDAEILDWATRGGFVVFTHDLDFGAILASRQLSTPSVVQLRGQETSPHKLAATVLLAFDQLRAELEAGALITIDAVRTRARVLPLPRR